MEAIFRALQVCRRQATCKPPALGPKENKKTINTRKSSTPKRSMTGIGTRIPKASQLSSAVMRRVHKVTGNKPRTLTAETCTRAISCVTRASPPRTARWRTRSTGVKVIILPLKNSRLRLFRWDKLMQTHTTQRTNLRGRRPTHPRRHRVRITIHHFWRRPPVNKTNPNQPKKRRKANQRPCHKWPTRLWACRRRIKSTRFNNLVIYKVRSRA